MQRKTWAEIETTAAEWVVRTEDGLSSKEHAQWTVWIEADLRHRVAFLRLQAASEIARRLAPRLEQDGELNWAMEEAPMAGVVVPLPKCRRRNAPLAMFESDRWAAGLQRLFSDASFREVLLRDALRITRRIEDAEDVVQKAYVSCVQKARTDPKWQPTESDFRYFVKRAADVHLKQQRNQPITYRSLRGRDEAKLRDLGEMGAAVDVEAILAAMPRQTLEIFFLFRIEGVPVKKIAARMQVSCETVEEHLREAACRVSDIANTAEANRGRKQDTDLKEDRTRRPLIRWLPGEKCDEH